MTVTSNIYQKQIKYHLFNAVTNSELTELVLVFAIRPAFLTSAKKVNTSFKNVWRTWGPAIPTLLADLLIFCPLCPTNFKNSVYHSLFALDMIKICIGMHQGVRFLISRIPLIQLVTRLGIGWRYRQKISSEE